MCGRIVQSSGPLRLSIVDGLDVSDSRLGNVPRRYNAAPSQELLVIRQNHKTGERSLALLKSGSIELGRQRIGRFGGSSELQGAALLWSSRACTHANLDVPSNVHYWG